jgi:hypothetical protein
MRTMFFVGFDPNKDTNRAFLRELRCLISFDADKRGKLLKAVFDILDIRSEKARKDRVETLAKEIKIPLPDVYSALGSCNFLMESLARDENKADKPINLGEDLRELTGISAEETSRFVEVVENIKRDAVDKYKVQKKRKSFEAGVLPSFRGCGVTVEMRAVIDDKFGFGMDLEKYKPKIVGHAPVISVHLHTDSGVLDEFIFQASPEELQLLVDNLRAALTEAEAFKKYISIKRGKE